MNYISLLISLKTYIFETFQMFLFFFQMQVAYKEFIRDVLIYLGAPRAEAAKFATDMFSYEKRIAEITPPHYTLQNPIATYNVISLSELKETNLVR